MRITLLVLAVAVVLGGLVGVLVARDPGYVLIAYQDTAVETSLWFAALVMLAIYALVRLVMFVLTRVGGGGNRLKGWHQRRRSEAARDQTERGQVLMAEGRWAEARKLLEAAAPRVPAPLINYLGAARAAHEMGDRQGRDELLRAAHQSTSGSRFAVGLTQAELQRADGQWEPCLASLLQLYRLSPRHPQVLRMLVSCYQHLQDWQAMLELMPELKKHKVVPEPALLGLQIDAWRGRVRTGREDPSELWKSVPRDLRREPALVAAFARALAAAGSDADAESIVRSALEHSWDRELVRLYGTLVNAEPERQMVVAEGWLKQRPNDPDLLLALGRISLMNHLWAKAREYLEASLRLRRSAEAQSELGRLCTALGESERGGELLTQALQSLSAPEPLPTGEGASMTEARRELDPLPALPLPERA